MIQADNLLVDPLTRSHLSLVLCTTSTHPALLAFSDRFCPPQSVARTMASSALQRIQRDMREFEATFPLKMRTGAAGQRWGVEAVPREDNLLLWDVKMVAASGSLAGREVKMLVEFDSDYPSCPPDVSLQTRIRHPNVFGDWICLDMLKDPGRYARPYQGWSAAYTLSGILMQLYGFLLVDEYVDQMEGGRRYRRDRYSGRSSGATSQHSAASTLAATTPSSSRPVSPVSSSSGASQSGPAHNRLEELSDHLLRHTLEFLSAEDLLRCTSGGSGRLAMAAADIKQRKELICFYSRLPYTDTVLGYGVLRDWFVARSKRSGDLKSLVVRLDYLSQDAFNQAQIRRSAWNVRIDGFLPLYLNPEHGKRALAVLPGCVRQLLTAPERTVSNPYRLVDGMRLPQQLLTVLGQSMNSLVVEMVKLDKGTVPMHMSDAALRGFCHLHHLLLAVALSPLGKELIKMAEQDVLAFVQGADGGAARHKSRCPDLGQLLIKLLLVPEEVVSWGSLMPVLLRQSLARQVLWIIDAESGRSALPSYRRFDPYEQPRRQTAPRFAYVQGEDRWGGSQDSHERMRRHFGRAVTGIRTILLTSWFGRHCARPKTAAGVTRELQAVKSVYDALSGAPAAEQLEAFNKHARAVMKVGLWAQMLGLLNGALRVAQGPDGQAPDVQGLWADVLRQAVVDSYVAGYHHEPAPWRDSNAVSLNGPYEAAAWRRMYAPDIERLRMARRVFGRPFVDWEGPNKPVIALPDDRFAARTVLPPQHSHHNTRLLSIP